MSKELVDLVDTLVARFEDYKFAREFRETWRHVNDHVKIIFDFHAGWAGDVSERPEDLERWGDEFWDGIEKIVLDEFKNYEPGKSSLFFRINSKIRNKYDNPEDAYGAYLTAARKLSTTWLMAHIEGQSDKFAYLITDAFALFSAAITTANLRQSDNRPFPGFNANMTNIPEMGAAARAKMYKRLEDEAVRLYRAGNFRNMKQASEILLPLVNEYAKSIGATPLSIGSGHETIYKYLRRNK